MIIHDNSDVLLDVTDDVTSCRRHAPGDHEPVRLSLLLSGRHQSGGDQRRRGAEAHGRKKHQLSWRSDLCLPVTFDPCSLSPAARHGHAGLHAGGKVRLLQDRGRHHALWKHEVQEEAERRAGRGRRHREWDQRLFIYMRFSTWGAGPHMGSPQIQTGSPKTTSNWLKKTLIKMFSSVMILLFKVKIQPREQQYSIHMSKSVNKHYIMKCLSIRRILWWRVQVLLHFIFKYFSV